MVNDALVGLFQSEEGIEDFADWMNENKTRDETQIVLQKLWDFLWMILLLDYALDLESVCV